MCSSDPFFSADLTVPRVSIYAGIIELISHCGKEIFCWPHGNAVVRNLSRFTAGYLMPLYFFLDFFSKCLDRKRHGATSRTDTFSLYNLKKGKRRKSSTIILTSGRKKRRRRPSWTQYSNKKIVRFSLEWREKEKKNRSRLFGEKPGFFSQSNAHMKWFDRAKWGGS